MSTFNPIRGDEHTQDDLREAIAESAKKIDFPRQRVKVAKNALKTGEYQGGKNTAPIARRGRR